MLRLSDEAETAVNLADPDACSAAARAAAWRSPATKGRPPTSRPAATACTAVLTDAGGEALGTAPGEAWRTGRYRAPYLRDPLLDAGALVETLETATFWSNLSALRAAVTAALTDTLTATRARRRSCCATSRTCTRPARRCTSPCCARRPMTRSPNGTRRNSPPTQRSARAGAAITHHHGVGTDHRDDLPRRDRAARRRRAARGQGRARSGRHPQPRRADLNARVHRAGQSDLGRRQGGARSGLRSRRASTRPAPTSASSSPAAASMRSSCARVAAAEGRIVVAVGGDGLVRDVAEGVVGGEGRRWAIVPAGRGNDLARMLGLPTEVGRAGRPAAARRAEAARRHRPERHDRRRQRLLRHRLGVQRDHQQQPLDAREAALPAGAGARDPDLARADVHPHDRRHAAHDQGALGRGRQLRLVRARHAHRPVRSRRRRAPRRAARRRRPAPRRRVVHARGAAGHARRPSRGRGGDGARGHHRRRPGRAGVRRRRGTRRPCRSRCASARRRCNCSSPARTRRRLVSRGPARCTRRPHCPRRRPAPRTSGRTRR